MRNWLKDILAAGGVLVIAAAAAAVIHRAHAQEVEADPSMPNHPGHAQYHDVYQTWVIPTSPSIPCCNAKRNVNGEITGDCYPTSARVVNGHWVAKTDHGTEVEIPDEKIVHEKNPDPTGENAHLCESANDVVLCFRPPNMGY